MRYSALNALGRPRLAERMICGNQNIEYMLATKRSAREGVTITCMMNMRNKNILSPGANGHQSELGTTTEDIQIRACGSDRR